MDRRLRHFNILFAARGRAIPGRLMLNRPSRIRATAKSDNAQKSYCREAPGKR